MMKLLKRLARKISRIARSFLAVGQTLIGIRIQRNGKLDYARLIGAGWVFFLGIILAMIVVGAEVPLLTWASTVLVVLTAICLDEAVVMMSNCIERGPPEKVEEQPILRREIYQRA